MPNLIQNKKINQIELEQRFEEVKKQIQSLSELISKDQSLSEAYDSIEESYATDILDRQQDKIFEEMIEFIPKLTPLLVLLMKSMDTDGFIELIHINNSSA